MRRGSRRAALLLALAALAAGSVGLGCGDDEDSGDEVTIPEISTPAETTGGAESTTTAPESGGVTPGSGPGGTGGTSPGSGSGSGGGSGSGSTTPEDSATSDTPPAPGSPEEAFEKQCEQNPAACG